MSGTLFRQVQWVHEGKVQTGDLYIKNQRIERIDPHIEVKERVQEVNGEGFMLIPGLIDDQVHFREPGLTHKACIATESLAAVAGGVTSYMEMPNVVPPTLNMELLEAKYALAAQTSAANYSFYMGVSNDNAESALQINKVKNQVCGLKIFMGSSTGNMLVDNIITLERIFADSEVLIATHCEKESLVKENLARLQADGIDADHARFHPVIRDVEVCYQSSLSAIQLAKKFNTRLHILHITTAKELELFSNLIPLSEKRITAEVCVHHLHFTADDYEKLGNLIKCNPAIKSSDNREALWKALLDDRLDILATDHAPHTLEEKNKPYREAPAGLPLVQHSLLMLLDAVKQGRISIEKMVEKACHAPAILFEIQDRGYLREGYFADLVLLNLHKTTLVTRESLHYRCGWSPLEGYEFPAFIEGVWVNGTRYFDQGKQCSDSRGMRLQFHR